VTAFSRSLIGFQQCFPDEAACVGYQFQARWHNGFVCPGCGTRRAWELHTKPWSWECAGCHQQTSMNRHHPAPFQAAAGHLVLGGLSDGDPFQRHLGTCNCNARSLSARTIPVG
jgi:hypothetical protein